jgi:hypothetical protein
MFVLGAATQHEAVQCLPGWGAGMHLQHAAVLDQQAGHRVNCCWVGSLTAPEVWVGLHSPNIVLMRHQHVSARVSTVQEANCAQTSTAAVPTHLHGAQRNQSHK